MKREPSIHITQGNLVLILKEVLVDYPKLDKKTLAITIGKASRKYTCTHRSIITNTNKVVKDTERLKSSGNIDVFEFQTMLNKVRKSFRHVGIQTIKLGAKDWLILKEVASNALEFCNTFELNKKEGFVIYCKLGIVDMQRFNINKFQALHPKICEKYQAELLIEKDSNQHITSKGHNFYCKLVAERIGIINNYLDDPVNYSFFVRASEECLSVGGKIEDYIKGQFADFEWRNDYPYPSQLSGPKAKERFIKYAYKQNIQLKRAKV